VTDAMLAGATCVVGSAGAPGLSAADGIVLWGDSHAAHFIGVLGGVAERGGFSFRYISIPTCPPVFGTGEFGASYSRKQCQDARDGFKSALAASPQKTVALAGQWSVHNGNRQFIGALRRTVLELRASGHRVVLLAQVPSFPGFGRECETRWMRVGGGDCTGQGSIKDAGQTSVNRRLQQLATETGASHLDVHDVLCRDGRCSPYLDGKPAYFNWSHLSREGAWRVGRNLAASANYDAWLQALGMSGHSAAENAPKQAPR
jgi:hypothetical protein